LLLGLLERFGGYTLQTLLDEDARLLQLVRIQQLGNPEEEAPAPGGGDW